MNDDLRVTKYQDLGIRPLINCVGTLTTLSGSLTLPQVRQAMAEASTRYVVIAELMEAVGVRLAQVMQSSPRCRPASRSPAAAMGSAPIRT